MNPDSKELRNRFIFFFHFAMRNDKAWFMKLDIGTLAGIINRSKRILDRLQGGNTSQTCEKLSAVAKDANAAGALLGDLDALAQHIRVLSMAELEATK